MLGTTDRLMTLTAADLMSRDVLVVPQRMSLRVAAKLLSQVHVTGAPVVDDDGACIGVISATDFVRWVETDGKPRGATEPPACMCTAWQIVDIEALPADTVARYMTPDPVVVAPTAPIQEVARVMVDAHIHRVIVTDARRRPVGVVSSTDLVAALARANAED